VSVAGAMQVRVSAERARRLLVRNRELVIRDGETKVVGVARLSADDGSARPSSLTFRVSRVPRHGTLGLAGKTTSPASTFTQADIRAQRVGIIIVIVINQSRTHITAICPGLPGWGGTGKVKPIWILLKQETVAVASAGLYASLHLAPDR